MSLVAFRDDFCLSFMFANHVWRSYGALWLEQAATGKLGQLSSSAIGALSKTNFGKTNHEALLENQGLLIYGRCLKDLSGQISQVRAGGQELIIPILIMLMHAVSTFLSI